MGEFISSADLLNNEESTGDMILLLFHMRMGKSFGRCQIKAKKQVFTAFFFLTFLFGLMMFSVPFAHSAPYKLNDTLVANGDVWEYAISPDSSRVVYRADQDTDGVVELYSVSLSGGSVTNLNTALVASGDVLEFAISLDSSRMVYWADQDTAGVLELYGNTICPALIIPVLMLLMN